MTTPSNTEMVVSLTDPSVGAERVRPSRVGGKSSSLAKLYRTEGLGSRVPEALALTVDFFAPWVDEITASSEFGELQDTLNSSNNTTEREKARTAIATCAKLRERSLRLVPSAQQSEALRVLETHLKARLAAVRSSAPEEDGSGASFAGAFETKLAVETSLAGLTTAVRECFASLWEYRVLLYKQQQQAQQVDGSGNGNASSIGFAVTVMEMVDSVIAGVAFSANPLNSDRDEIVIDSSWGLGESVVDGSVTADRYIVDKLTGTTLVETVGTKGSEKRIAAGAAGGVANKPISKNDPRYEMSTLDATKIKALAGLVCLIEKTYGMPMDIEWAFVADNKDNNSSSGDRLVPKLLQARPITTLFVLDPELMTKPGEKRRLYFDQNILSEATTTTPFTTLDIEYYNGVFEGLLFRKPFGLDKDPSLYFMFNPDAPMFWGRTRQYLNFGWVLKFASKEKIADMSAFIDPYMSSIFRSKDCDEKRYRTNFWWPRGYTIGMIWQTYRDYQSITALEKDYRTDTKAAIQKYKKIIQTGREKLFKMVEKGFDFDGSIGLAEITRRLMEVYVPIYHHGIACVKIVVPLFSELEDQRVNGASEEIREEFEDLCGGFEGDPLMEINMAIYRLAQSLPAPMRDEKADLGALVEQIREEKELPAGFLSRWKSFLDEYGFDGQDQLFISCPRYRDAPERLLRKLQMNAGAHVRDPSEMLREKVAKRRAVMAKQEREAEEDLARAVWFWDTYKLKKKLAAIRTRNNLLEDAVWTRNNPKIHMTEVLAAFRIFVLKAEDKLIADGRLEQKGDIFHLKTEEIDRVLLSNPNNNNNNSNNNIDLMELVRPRKAFYEKVVAMDQCPMVVDSRCRILKADPPEASSDDPHTLVGAAISPGVATGIVKIIRDLSPETTEGFGFGPDGKKEDHVLCAHVTGPAWTPLFASAVAVVLQIGGVLQHGALCAREYGKPAVSNIDIYGRLEDGMRVSVDGNTGIVTILEDNVAAEKEKGS